MLIESSATSTLAETGRARLLGTATPIDTNYSPSDLRVTVTGLPSNGTVLLADGLTPVHLTQSLSLVQLGTLKFGPARSGAGVPNSGSPASGLASAVVEAETSPLANCPVLIVPENSRARTIGIQLSADSNIATTESYAIITGLPSNGTVFFPDGTTAVTRGQTLTSAQLKRLRFKPAVGSVGQIATLNYLAVDSAARTTACCVLLIVGPETPALGTDAPSKLPSGSMAASAVASVGIAALMDTYLSSASSSALTQSLLQTEERSDRGRKECGVGDCRRAGGQPAEPDRRAIRHAGVRHRGATVARRARRRGACECDADRRRAGAYWLEQPAVVSHRRPIALDRTRDRLRTKRSPRWHRYRTSCRQASRRSATPDQCSTQRRR